MGFHTFPVDRAEALEDVARYRFLSREELLARLDPEGDETVLDLGSGTGFYTDDVAPFVGRVVAIDVQRPMHSRYAEKGIPEGVEPVVGAIASLPLEDASIDAAFTTMTFHEFFDEVALREIDRVLRPNGRLVIVDWSRTGLGEAGPDPAERCSLEGASGLCRRVGLDVVHGEERPETFVLVAMKRGG